MFMVIYVDDFKMSGPTVNFGNACGGIVGSDIKFDKLWGA